MAGGQPISMANMRAVRELTGRHGIPIYLDATRAVENALFIRGARRATPTSLRHLLEFCFYSDGCTMSGKRIPLTNIGGWLATNDDALFEARNLVVVYEGLHTYGGMAGRDAWRRWRSASPSRSSWPT